VAVTPEQAIEAADAAFGRHDGYRAFHARGTLLTGIFTATPEAAELTRAAHFSGQPVPTTVRVSNGAGNPKLPDFAPDVRGFAVKFELPDGSGTDIVAQTAPQFPVATPEGFVELVAAFAPRPSAVWRVPRFFARYPGAARILAKAAPTLSPPASYATIPYYALHAYRFLDAQDDARYVRYTFVPENRQPRLGAAKAARRGRDYLQQEIRERLARGAVRFTLELQIAEPLDPVDDPSKVWPEHRRRVTAGTLEITGLHANGEAASRSLVFDPARVTDGIELSDDPVLRFRPRAYSRSAERRMED
jgi:catalase